MKARLSVAMAVILAGTAIGAAEMDLAAAGGRLVLGGKGRLVVVDTVDSPVTRALAPKVEHFARLLHIHVVRKVQSGGPGAGTFRIDTAGTGFGGERGEATIWIGDDRAYPATLVAQEARWALVNLAPLKVDSPAETVLAERLHKTFLRAACLLTGAAPGRFPASPLRPVCSLAEVDALKDTTLTFDAAMNMDFYMKGIGIEQYQVTTYKAACEDGTAPAPTNDIQRAVWEQVKADKERGPTNPITIPPPNQKK